MSKDHIGMIIFRRAKYLKNSDWNYRRCIDFILIVTLVRNSNLLRVFQFRTCRYSAEQFCQRKLALINILGPVLFWVVPQKFSVRDKDLSSVNSHVNRWFSTTKRENFYTKCFNNFHARSPARNLTGLNQRVPYLQKRLIDFCAGKISMTVWYRNHFDYFCIYFTHSFLNTLHNLFCMSTYKLNSRSFQCILSILIHNARSGFCSSDNPCGLDRRWRQNILVTNRYKMLVTDFAYKRLHPMSSRSLGCHPHPQWSSNWPCKRYHCSRSYS